MTDSQVKEGMNLIPISRLGRSMSGSIMNGTCCGRYYREHGYIYIKRWHGDHWNCGCNDRGCGGHDFVSSDLRQLSQIKIEVEELV